MFVSYRMSGERYAAKYLSFTKVFQLDNKDILDELDLKKKIKEIYKSEPSFPNSFNVQYNDKELGYVDLDDTLQLKERKDNILLVAEIPSCNTLKAPSDSSSISSNEEGEYSSSRSSV